MKIINKTTRDFVPKIIMHLIINNVREFVKHEIIAHIYSLGDQVIAFNSNKKIEL